jgi:hypothetical protein
MTFPQNPFGTDEAVDWSVKVVLRDPYILRKDLGTEKETQGSETPFDMKTEYSTEEAAISLDGKKSYPRVHSPTELGKEGKNRKKL